MRVRHFIVWAMVGLMAIVGSVQTGSTQSASMQSASPQSASPQSASPQSASPQTDLAQPTSPTESAASTFIRPYRPPQESTILEKRLRLLEEEAGRTRFDFEYSLPADSKLMVKVIFRKNGIVDKKASALFYITRKPDEPRNNGSFAIIRCFPQPKNPDDDNRWYVMLDDRYGYGFLEGTPDDYPSAGTLQQKTIVGAALQAENLAFAYEEDNEEFSMVVRVKVLPLEAKDKINEVIRHPLP